MSKKPTKPLHPLDEINRLVWEREQRLRELARQRAEGAVSPFLTAQIAEYNERLRTLAPPAQERKVRT